MGTRTGNPTWVDSATVAEAEANPDRKITAAKLNAIEGAIDNSAEAVHDHDATDITTGTLSPDRLGTGTRDGSRFLRDDGAWAEPPPGGGASTLGDLTDVDTTGATAGDVLKYDGSEWSPDAASAGSPTAYELRGTGMPNGVVTADPGTYYTDEAGTNGAWRWLKKTGTGNTGWTVLEGDTGWRYFTDAQLLNGYTAYVSNNGYRPALRRIGAAVYISGALGNIQAAKTNGGGILALPSGFQPNSVNSSIVSGRLYAFAGNSSLPNTLLNIASNTLQIAYPASVDAALASGIIDMRPWTTTDAWPASLPGSPL